MEDLMARAMGSYQSAHADTTTWLTPPRGLCRVQPHHERTHEMQFTTASRPYPESGYAIARKIGEVVSIAKFSVLATRDETLAKLKDDPSEADKLKWYPNTEEYWTQTWRVDAFSAPDSVDELWALVRERANELGLSEEYDKFASEHGGPPRPPIKRAYVAYVRVPVIIDGQKNEAGVHAEFMRMAEEDITGLRQQVVTGLLSTIRTIEAIPLESIAWYVSILDPGDTGRVLSVL